MKQQNTLQESDLPKLAAPAQRALTAAGVRRLKDLARFNDAEVKIGTALAPMLWSSSTVQ